MGAYHNMLKAIKLGILAGSKASRAEILRYYKKKHDISTTLQKDDITKSLSNNEVYVSLAKQEIGIDQYDAYEHKLEPYVRRKLF